MDSLVVGETGELVRVKVAQVTRHLGEDRACVELVSNRPTRLRANRYEKKGEGSVHGLKVEEQMKCVGGFTCCRRRLATGASRSLAVTNEANIKEERGNYDGRPHHARSKRISSSESMNGYAPSGRRLARNEL